MKQIGRMTDGKHLIEITDDELHVFKLLITATLGKVINSVYANDVHLDTNMTSTFTAIRLWIEQADTVNQLQHAVDRMRKALGVQGGKCTCDPSKGDGCSECP